MDEKDLKRLIESRYDSPSTLLVKKYMFLSNIF